MNSSDIAVTYKRLQNLLIQQSLDRDEYAAVVSEFNLLFEHILASSSVDDTTQSLDLLLRCLLILDAALKSTIAITLRIWKMYIALLKGFHGGIRSEMAENLLGVLHSYVAGGVQSLVVTEDAAAAANMIDILLFFFQRMCASLVYLSAVLSAPSRDTAVATICSLRSVLQTKNISGASVHISAVDNAFFRLVSKSITFPLLSPSRLGGAGLRGYCGVMVSVLRSWSSGGEFLPAGTIVSALREVIAGLSALSCAVGSEGGCSDEDMLQICDAASVAYSACLDRTRAQGGGKMMMELEVTASACR